MSAPDPVPLATPSHDAPDPEPDPVPAPADPGGKQSDAHELALLRDLIVAALPDVVPELIEGDDVAALLASIPAAREAHARVIEAVGAANASIVPAPSPQSPPSPIPSGTVVRSFYPDPATLSPLAKIRHGLVREQGAGSRE